MSLQKYDSNMQCSALQNDSDYVFYPAHEAPFQYYGLIKDDDDVFRRIPHTVAETVSEGVVYTNNYTSGGRFLFRTNANRLALKATMPFLELQRSVNYMNCGGMDIYVRQNGTQHLVNSFRKPEMDPSITSWAVESPLYDNSDKEVVVYTSAYATLKDIYIGIPHGCYLEAAAPYTYNDPVVFYGSSITQGASASRPAITYPALLSQALDCDFINLGFAGNGKAEQEIADYIAGLSMSAFVYDYDHNSPSVEHLKKTHENMYLTIRKKHPTLPIIMMSRPQYHAVPLDQVDARFRIIEQTYQNALARGENVFLLDGRHFYDKFGYSNCVQDASHPNTLGMYAIYDAVLPILKKALASPI